MLLTRLVKLNNNTKYQSRPGGASSARPFMNSEAAGLSLSKTRTACIAQFIYINKVIIINYKKLAGFGKVPEWEPRAHSWLAQQLSVPPEA